ncbi:MAG: hypothetical protein AB4352_08585 [Hormoscilla sp.]
MSVVGGTGGKKLEMGVKILIKRRCGEFPKVSYELLDSLGMEKGKWTRQLNWQLAIDNFQKERR